MTALVYMQMHNRKWRRVLVTDDFEPTPGLQGSESLWLIPEGEAPIVGQPDDDSGLYILYCYDKWLEYWDIFRCRNSWLVPYSGTSESYWRVPT